MRAVYDEYYDFAVGAAAAVVRTDSGFSVGAARSRVGEIPLSVTGDKYYKLGYRAPHRSSQFPLLFSSLSLSLFFVQPPVPLHIDTLHEGRRANTSSSVSPYPGASPPASFLSPLRDKSNEGAG